MNLESLLQLSLVLFITLDLSQMCINTQEEGKSFITVLPQRFLNKDDSTYLSTFPVLHDLFIRVLVCKVSRAATIQILSEHKHTMMKVNKQE